MTEAAGWIDSTFAGFDYAILQAMHNLAEWGGVILTPFFQAVSFVGEFGAFTILLAVVLLFFPKTRMAGVGMLIALLLGFLMTNLFLKEVIARERPFSDTTSDYYQWWMLVGSSGVWDASFPSGHTTAAMAGMTALFLLADKKIAWIGFVFVFIMGLSRCYLMVHYPSDVIAGLLVGALAGFLSYLLVSQIKKRREGIPQPSGTV